MRASPSADLVLRNGRIYTVDARRSWASAVAISKGRFVAVGDDSAVESFIGASTEVIDLGGRMTMPGIVDIHTHILMGGRAEMFDLNFSSACDVDEICAAVSGSAAKSPPGAWIVGAQWGGDRLPALNLATSLARLDEAAQGHPVLLRDDSRHNCWCSSEALRVAGVTKDTPNPARGEIGRDPQSGELTGVMIESAAGVVERALAQSGRYTPKMDRAAIARSIETLNSFGVTAFLDAASMKEIMAALKGLDDRGALTAWAGCAMPAVEPPFMVGPLGRRADRASRQVQKPPREAGLRQGLPRRRPRIPDGRLP